MNKVSFTKLTKTLFTDLPKTAVKLIKSLEQDKPNYKQILKELKAMQKTIADWRLAHGVQDFTWTVTDPKITNQFKLLVHRTFPYINNAIEAIEREPYYPEVAIERLNSIQTMLNKAVQNEVTSMQRVSIATALSRSIRTVRKIASLADEADADGNEVEKETENDGKLKVLTDPDAQKLAMKIYTGYVSENDYSDLVLFLKDFDSMLAKYRKGKPLTKSEIEKLEDQQGGGNDEEGEDEGGNEDGVQEQSDDGGDESSDSDEDAESSKETPPDVESDEPEQPEHSVTISRSLAGYMAKARKLK